MEYLDIVNDDNKIVGRASKDECHLKGYMHRSVFVFIFTTSGKLVLQQRSSKKAIRPNKITASACGHVLSGEDYATAAIRELKEELGITTNLRHILIIHGPYDYDREIISLYEGVTDEIPIPNNSEIDDLLYISPIEIMECIRSGNLNFGDSFKIVFEKYMSSNNTIIARNAGNKSSK